MLKNNKTFKVTKKNSMLLLNAVNNKTGQSETAIVISLKLIQFTIFFFFIFAPYHIPLDHTTPAFCMYFLTLLL